MAEWRGEIIRDVDALASEAVSALRKFLGQPEHAPGDVARARIAASAFSACTRVKQTETARESNFLILARELAQNTEEFRKYVRIAMPNAPIVQAIPATTESNSPRQTQRGAAKRG